MVSRTLIRYFGRRFLGAVASVFFGIFVLVVLVDYVEFMRRASDAPNVSAWLVAQGLVLPRAAADRAAPALLGAGRRHGLLPGAVAAQRAGDRARRRNVGMAVRDAGADRGLRARAAGNGGLQSALGRDARMVEAARGGDLRRPSAGMQQSQSGFWVRQRSVDGQSVVYAASSQEQGVRLDGVSVFTFDTAGHEMERIEAKRASARAGPLAARAGRGLRQRRPAARP